MSTSVVTEIQSRLDSEQRSQSWLADRLGISKSAMSRKMKGETEFSLDEFLAASKALGADPAEIVSALVADSDRPAA